MAQPSLIIGDNNWAVKETSLLGYNVIQNKYSPIPIDTVRATTATRVNSAGLIEVVPYNLLQRSEEFDNASWVKGSDTFITTGFTDPFGGSNASRLTMGSGSGTFLNQSLTFSAIPYTFSVWAKANGNTNLTLQISNSAETSYVLTNDWQRIILTFTPTAGVSQVVIGNGIFTVDALIYGAQLDQGSTATEYYPTTTRLNIPRIDYTNGSCPSLLVEPQRTNLLLRSEEFDNASWAKGNLVVTPNTDISPDGLLNSDKLIPNNLALLSSISNFARQPITKAASSIQYTYSVFAKQSGLNSIRLFSSSSVVTDNASSTFLLVDGSISVSAVASGNFSGASASVVDYENGWYRCTLTFTTNSETTLTNRIIPTDSVLTMGDGILGVLLWGAQLEEGSYATSYIPTVASTVTRNADVISKTGISGLIGQTEGTIFVDFNLTKSPSDLNGRLLQLWATNDTTNAILPILNQSNQLQITVFKDNSGAAIVPASSSTLLSFGINKIAIAYTSTTLFVYRNGVLFATGNPTGFFPSSLNSLNLGCSSFANRSLENTINSAQLYKTALTDQECINLTTL